MDEYIHECTGTEENRTMIRYSTSQYAWLMFLADGGKQDICYCPYCGEDLGEV